MSGQIELTLRPPPNVDFVHGYPGIPPATPDRPQAAVKGAIEVRVGPQGVKAQWVQVALRKVETLPGGGQDNTFRDVVGPSPLYLWKASQDDAVLHAQDFPFCIHIPEAIPPTVLLDRGAGIEYELVATVCTTGKRGIFQRNKEVLQTTFTTVMIDKHELHSTWPVYCQHEYRRQTQEGVTLTVNRKQSCFGPGDRVAVMATLRSNTLKSVALRGFEFVLKEVTVFRPAHNKMGKVGPHAKTVVIGEQKVPLNATLYGGTQHKAELAVVIPTTHTTPSLSSARHIDITYTINVKVLMGTGSPLIMEIPVTISNWPRGVSVEAMRRIGPAPSLSRTQPGSLSRGNNVLHPVAHTVSGNSTLPPGGVEPYTVGGRGPDVGGDSKTATTKFGTSGGGPGKSGRPGSENRTAVYGTQLWPAIAGAQTGSYPLELAGRPVGAAMPISPGSTGGLNSRRSQSVAGPQTRLDITNIVDVDIPVDPVAISANRDEVEDEIQRLHDAARDQAERTQAQAPAAGNRSNAPRKDVPVIAQPTRNVSPPAIAPASGSDAPSWGTQWPTSEEEKVRLFTEAQAAVKRRIGYDPTIPVSDDPMVWDEESQSASRLTQDDASKRTQGCQPAAPVDDEKTRYVAAQNAVRKMHGYDPNVPVIPVPLSQPSSASASASNYGPSAATSSSWPPQKMCATDMYSQAINAMNRPPLNSGARTSLSLKAAKPPAAKKREAGVRRSAPVPIKTAAPQHPSAEDERAALMRCHEVKQPVDKTQDNVGTSGSGSAVASRNVGASSFSSSTLALTPTTSSSTSQRPSGIVKKEKLSRIYEIQDALVAAVASNSQPPSDLSPPVPAASSSTSQQPSRRKS